MKRIRQNVLDARKNFEQYQVYMHQATEQYQHDYWVKLHTYIADPLPPEEYLPSVDIRSLENYARYGWTYLYGSGGIYVDTRTQIIDDKTLSVSSG